MSAHLCIMIKKKDIFILGEGRKQGLDDARVTGEARHLINLIQPNERFVSSLHYNGSKIFLTVNVNKAYQLKAKAQKLKFMQCVYVILQKNLQLIV